VLLAEAEGEVRERSPEAVARVRRERHAVVVAGQHLDQRADLERRAERALRERRDALRDHGELRLDEMVGEEPRLDEHGQHAAETLAPERVVELMRPADLW